MTELSQSLKPIFDWETARGNLVEYIAEPAGSSCPFAVVFAKPLDRAGIEQSIQLASSVKYWESRDSHYSIEAGYYCDASRHSISGPIPDSL